MLSTSNQIIISGRPGFSLEFQGVLEVPLRLFVAWPDPKGFFELGNCLVQFSLNGQCSPEVIVCPGVVRINLQSHFELCNGPIKSSHACKGDPQVMVGRRIIGHELYSLGKMQSGPKKIPLLCESEPQVVL